MLTQCCDAADNIACGSYCQGAKRRWSPSHLNLAPSEHFCRLPSGALRPLASGAGVVNVGTLRSPFRTLSCSRHGPAHATLPAETLVTSPHTKLAGSSFLMGNLKWNGAPSTLASHLSAGMSFLAMRRADSSPLRKLVHQNRGREAHVMSPASMMKARVPSWLSKCWVSWWFMTTFSTTKWNAQPRA